MLVSGGMCLFIGMYPHFLVDLRPRFIVRVSLSPHIQYFTAKKQ